MSVPVEPSGAFGPAHAAAARLIPADAVPVTDEDAAPAGADTDTDTTEDGGVRALLLRLRAAAADAPRTRRPAICWSWWPVR